MKIKELLDRGIIYLPPRAKKNGVLFILSLLGSYASAKASVYSEIPFWWIILCVIVSFATFFFLIRFVYELDPDEFD